MKILFVYPNVTRQRSPQLGICMIAAIAHHLGHECDLYDLTTAPKKEEISTFQSKLESFGPDLLAVSCRSNEWPFINQLFQSVDTGNILKVFGGPHATVAPEEVINIADIVVIGEGEDTFSELLKRIAGGEDITNIAGCWIKQGSGIIKNEMRNLISDLDKLPFPYWKIFDDIHYYNSYIKRLFNGAKVVGTFEGSRGCPYACTYCSNDYVRTLYKGKGKWHREKSPKRIVQEVRLFRNQYGLDCIYWIDEVVLTNIDRLERFRDLHSSEIGVPFVFMERPENMIDEKVNIIKQAGAQRVSIGIEAGDENIRRNLLNRHYPQETIVSAFQTAKKYGLTTYAFTMIGFPGEDRDSIKVTYKLLRKARPDMVQTTIFYPLKKTKLYEKVVNEGLFDPHLPMPRDYYGESCLNFPKNKKKELLRWQYVLINYNSRIIGLFVLALPSQSIFRILVFLRKVYVKFREEGFLSISKAIMQRISVLLEKIILQRHNLKHSLMRCKNWKDRVMYYYKWDLRDNDRTVYDRICTGYTKEEFEKDDDSIVYTLNPQKTDICLDIGCGIGRVEKYLYDKVKEIHAVDFSPQMIDLAKERMGKYPNVKFYVNDGESLNMFKDGYFDIAFAELVFQRIPPEIVKKYVAEVYRVLKPGGRFISQIPTKKKYKHLPREICGWFTKEEVYRLFSDFRYINFESEHTNVWYFSPIVTK